MVGVGGPAAAQEAGPNGFGIVDNSFLVEEAFNQEPGTFQNIFVAGFRGRSEREFVFTQEWPLWSDRHQFGYSLPIEHIEGQTGLGDAVLSYRYQVWHERDGRPALAPRVSVIMPTGDGDDPHRESAAGLQVNLPFSKQHGRFYVHGNAGVTWQPDLDATSPHLGASAIWNTRPLLNLMAEALAEFGEDVTLLTVSPGLRGGWNAGDSQTILGVAIPLQIEKGSRDASLLLYFSYEGPFR